MSESVNKKYLFMKQQGFNTDHNNSAERHFDLLLFQPLNVGAMIMLAIALQSFVMFLIVGSILWFNTVLPGFNPFERLLDRVTKGSAKHFPLPPAPAPRRFMQGMAGSLMFMAAISMTYDFTNLSYVFQGFIALAFAMLIFGKFCVGAYIYHVLTGNVKFANQTCPWSQSA